MHAQPHELASIWLDQAASDLDGARKMLETGHFDIVCFLSQQVAEKALKGLLIWLSGSRQRTHVIAEFIREARTHYEFEGDPFEDAEILDQYYVSTRYPDALGGALPAATFRRRQSQEAVEIAERLLSTARTIVPSEEPKESH